MLYKYLDKELNLPDDTVLGVYPHGRDLYIIYTRSVLRIPNYEGGNTSPEEAYTLEMADYYSYDDPMLITDPDGGLWCHIGGRLFCWDTSKSRWIERSQFHVERYLRTETDFFVFKNHLLYDEDPEGMKYYNFRTGQLFVTVNKTN